MRRPLVLLSQLALALATASALAAQPPGLQPLPDMPPPPPGISGDSDLEPQVTITKRGADKVEEFRLNGKLYMLKVTPPHGVPYYLVDDSGKGEWAQRDNIGPNVQPPMWVIHTF